MKVFRLILPVPLNELFCRTKVFLIDRSKVIYVKIEGIRILIRMLMQILVNFFHSQIIGNNSRKSKITNLGAALSINENVGWLEIAVHNIC